MTDAQAQEKLNEASRLEAQVEALLAQMVDLKYPISGPFRKDDLDDFSRKVKIALEYLKIGNNINEIRAERSKVLASLGQANAERDLKP